MSDFSSRQEELAAMTPFERAFSEFRDCQSRIDGINRSIAEYEDSITREKKKMFAYYAKRAEFLPVLKRGMTPEAFAELTVRDDAAVRP